VPIEEPAWWYGEAARSAPWPTLLEPAASLYGWLAARRMSRAPAYRAPVPVVCVGNFTLGGTGKTPLIRELVRRVRALGRQPVVLSRGYGGKVAGPHWVADDDPARLIGDEPRLIAADAPVVVSRDRPAGARAAVDRCGPDAVILMDDGLQNPSLAKDLTFAIVDARRGFGNGRVFPAGPLRAPLAAQWPRADALVVNRPPGAADEEGEQLSPPPVWNRPVLRARTEPAAALPWPPGTPVVAWAGIANPERFFGLLRSLGADLRATVAFPDHHAPSEREAQDLLDRATAAGAAIATTEKDMARCVGTTGPSALLAERSVALPIRLTFSDDSSAALDRLLAAALARLP